MIFRFCLYGFLKNQRYFEPFWILAFLDRGLSFAVIGALMGFREISVAVMEIPTGAIADVVGRRWSMIFSHLAYVAAFLAFGLTQSVGALFAAMFAFAVGEAFRTGTHKAIIFAWLKSQGREAEKTHVYGVTRSWSKIGSAVSVLIAAAFVFVLREYSVIFWISAVPAALNIVNFLGYPKELDGSRSTSDRGRGIVAVLWSGTARCFRSPALRRPILESMGYEGMFKASKDYLQPIIQQLMIALPLFVAWQESQRTAVMIAVVYAALYLLGSLASRNAGPLAKKLGDDKRAARWLWAGFAASFALLLVGTLTAWISLAIITVLILSVLQNLWRPILIGRVADQAEEEAMATVLSVESQAKSLGVAAIAPLLGLAVDHAPPAYRFAPIAAFGIAIAVLALLPTRAAAVSTDELTAGPGQC